MVNTPSIVAPGDGRCWREGGQAVGPDITGHINDYRMVPLPDEPPLYRETSPGIYETAPIYDEYEAPLVLGAISQKHYEHVVNRKPLAFLVYPNTVKVVRDPKLRTKPPKTKRGKIDAFSEKSRRRVRRAAVDAWPALTSQFVLTYPAEFPQDGKVSKKHLQKFLDCFRKHFKGHPYLWVLEFQRRGAPHYHLFLDLPVTEENRLWLASTWCRVSCDDDPAALAFHSHERNFISWDMGNGSYVAKYLEKDNQKFVPDGYTDVGRFWGTSRGLIPKPLYLEAEGMMDGYQGKGIHKPVTRAVRILARYHQHITTRWGLDENGRLERKGRSRVRSAKTIFSFQVIHGKKIYSKILKWYERNERGKENFKSWIRARENTSSLSDCIPQAQKIKAANFQTDAMTDNG